MFDPVVQFKKQDWYSLKRRALESGKLFVDPEFPPSNESLYSNEQLAPYSNIVWKRPKVKLSFLDAVFGVPLTICGK